MQFEPPVEAVRVIDPRMKVNQKRIQTILIGPKESTYQIVSANTSTNPNVVNFSYTTPSPANIIDRRFYVRYDLDITITGTGNPLTAYGVSDALRFLPINSSCTSLELTLNNAKTAVVPYQWMDAFSRFIPMDVLRKELSLSTSQPDLFGDYADGTGPKNVLGSYTDNSINSPSLRGSIVPISSSEGNGTSTFRFLITEPLFCPPLLYQDKDVNGFIGVQNISLQLNHTWNLSTTWSHASGGNALSAITVGMHSPPELLLSIMTPNDLVEPYDEKKTYAYNSSNITPYVTQAGNILSGATTNVQSGNIQLSCIPSRIFVCARMAKNSKTVETPDTFLRLNSVSVQFGNKSGLLASADSDDLYQISKRNGYQYDYNAFHDYQGSVLCLKPNEDLSLDIGEAPGLVVTKQLQITANITNQTGATVNTELLVLPVSPGAWYNVNGQSTQSIGLLGPEQVFNAPIVENVSYEDYSNIDIYGSGISDWFKSIWSGIKDKAIPFIEKKAAPWLLKQGSKVLKKYTGVDLGGKLPVKKGRGRPRKITGGDIIGGCEDCDDQNMTSREYVKQMFEEY